MKKKSQGKKNRGLRTATFHKNCVLGAALLVSFGVARAADEKEEAEEAEEPDNTVFEGGTNTFNNWLTFSAGGLLIDGSDSQAQQARRLPDGAFGGIEDFHYSTEVAKKTTFAADGRGIYDHDYNLSFALTKEETYFLRVHLENHRTWYNGDGGYYPPGSLWYPLAGSALGLDRGEISVEGGLTPKKWPALYFKYSHLTRDGEKSSTSWGFSHPVPGPDAVTRGLNPSFYDIDETRDIFELNAKYKIKATDVGLGLRYETGNLDNARKIWQWPNEGSLAGESRITSSEGSSYDLFSVHAFSETWIKKNLFLSTGYLYSTFDDDYSGSRIYGSVYGSDFDISYPGNGAGYYDLSGGGQKQEHVVNLNVMYNASKTVTVVPSLRVQRQDWNANSGAFETLGNRVPGFVVSNTDGDLLDVRERLDVRYSGITNCLLYAQGEWTQGQGNLEESGGIYLGGPIRRESEDSRFFQKYTLGCRIYPARRVNLDVGGYFKHNSYDYDHEFDSTANAPAGNRYPAFIVMRDFETVDGYTRVTWRPRPNLTLVSRYEFQLSTIHTTPDAVSSLSKMEASEMTSHIIAQNVNWSPWSRVYFQVGFNYVLSETETPASDYTAAVLDSQNNYWTLNFNSGFVLDNKTDLNLGYTYYRSDNYTDNSISGLPLGSGAEEHGISATLIRRLSERVRVSLRYGYYHAEDELYGGRNDYDAHVLYSSLQYRF